ncbi:MAG: glycosyltransferase family 4 protein, partial [Burkholderiaceae bacterium]
TRRDRKPNVIRDVNASKNSFYIVKIQFYKRNVTSDHLESAMPQKNRTPKTEKKTILLLSAHARSLINFRGPLLKDLLAKGLHVHVAAPDIDADKKIASALSALGVVSHNLALNRASFNPLSDIYSFINIILLLIRIKPDFIFTYNIKPVLYGCMAARIARIPVRTALITGLGYAFSESKSLKSSIAQRITRTLYRKALKSATLVIFQNQDDPADLKREGILDSHTNYVVVGGSGVDTQHFTYKTRTNAQPRFLMLSRLLIEKGVRDYVDAAKIVKSIHPKVDFVLAGEIDSNPNSIKQEELDSWIANNDICYLGRIPDVREELSSCTAFVLPSYYREGIPRTILEALASGRPVITTNSVGCKEPIEEGLNGFLVPPKSPQLLAERMLILIHDQALAEKMGASAREVAENCYDVRIINSTMLSKMGII